MRKRILSIFMALCLCCALLPTTALAVNLPWESSPVDWTALTGGQTLTDGGKYYLTDNITISSTISITGDVTLDLNGHTLTYQNEGTKGSVLKVGDGGSNSGNLTLQDSGTGGKITGGTGFSGTNTDTSGGGVYVNKGSTFTMTGGTIENCSATIGGGVYVHSDSFTMSGGTIENCTAASDGGGVYVNIGVTFKMSGTAAIKSCSATSNGGAVYVGGTLEMGTAGSGTEIGILAGSDGKTNDVFVNENCSIKKATDATDDACLPISAKVSLERNSTIEGGKFTGEVGAATNNDNFKINGGTFASTSTVNNSGTISGGTFSGTVNNTGENNSSISGGTFTANSIVNNKSGGNITGGTFAQGSIINNESGGNITGNTGSATLKYPVTFNANGGKFDGNKTEMVVYAAKDGTATAPDSAPTNTDGSRFMYWYQGKETTTPFDFANKTITAPITLKAKWSAGSAKLPYTTTIAKKEGADTPPAQTFKLEVYTTNNLSEKIPEPEFILDGDTTLTTNGAGISERKELTLFWAHRNFINSTNSFYIKQVPAADSNAANWTYDDTVYYCTSDGQIYTTTKNENNGSYASTGTTVPTMTFTHTYNYTTPVTPTPTPDPTPTPSTSSGGSSGSSRHSVSASHAANGSLSLNRKRAIQGESVTITVKPDSGYLLESLTVLNSSGKEIEVVDNGDGTYSFIMPRGDVKIEPIFVEEPVAEEPIEEETPTETPAEDSAAEPADENNALLNFFVDVFHGDYYYDAVLWAAENGITGGTDALRFAPNQPCSRAQIVTFLWRAAGCPEPTAITNPYTDISTDAYYYKAVLWAMEQGITSGTTPTTFSPDDSCTRAQAASFLYRKEKAEGGGFTGAWMFRLPFADVPEWCYEAIAWCYMNEITGGTAETTFSPDDSCTRAQIVSFLYRAR